MAEAVALVALRPVLQLGVHVPAGQQFTVDPVNAKALVEEGSAELADKRRRIK